ncbi:MAG: hypothetical protein ACYDBV_04670 [Nitrospiria bacterium]
MSARRRDLINPNKVQGFPFRLKGEATAEGNTNPEVVTGTLCIPISYRSHPLKYDRMAGGLAKL